MRREITESGAGGLGNVRLWHRVREAGGPQRPRRHRGERLSREPIEGNPAPRVFETEAGMINSIGLQNIGVRAFVEDKLPALARYSTAVFANVFGYQVDDTWKWRASSKTTRSGGLRTERFLPQYETRRYFLFERSQIAGRSGRRRVKRVARRPLIVKLSPNVSAHRTAGTRRGGEWGGCRLAGEYVRRAGHRPHTRKSRIGAGFGGLSGPAIKPIALRMVYQTARAVKIPVVGLGGIASGEDAAEFMIAGARGRWKWGRPFLGSAVAPDVSPKNWRSFYGARRWRTSARSSARYRCRWKKLSAVSCQRSARRRCLRWGGQSCLQPTFSRLDPQECGSAARNGRPSTGNQF